MIFTSSEPDSRMEATHIAAVSLSTHLAHHLLLESMILCHLYLSFSVPSILGSSILFVFLFICMFNKPYILNVKLVLIISEPSGTLKWNLVVFIGLDFMTASSLFSLPNHHISSSSSVIEMKIDPPWIGIAFSMSMFCKRAMGLNCVAKAQTLRHNGIKED